MGRANIVRRRGYTWRNGRARPGALQHAVHVAAMIRRLARMPASKPYIRYSYGLFNRIGGLLLRFRFNERLSIETRSGDQKSLDLLYTVEKD